MEVDPILWNHTRDLDDATFEQRIGELRAARRAAATAQAHERAMAAATCGLSLRDPSTATDSLIRSLAAAGMSSAEIERHIAAL